MQESHLFEYATIRVVPRVEREEFVNVGVILLCAKQKFLSCKIEINAHRILNLCHGVDLAEIKDHLQSLERICAGGIAGGRIGGLPIAERFRWLTATRSTIVQTSSVHPGLCKNPEETLLDLFDQLVKC